jgi:hypothetical protein
VTPTRDQRTTENERRGPRRGHANEVPARTDVSAIIKDSSGVAVEAEAASGCPSCGHDPVAALRQVVAERREAWRAGRRARRDVLEQAEFRGFCAGWEQAMEAASERRWAA